MEWRAQLGLPQGPPWREGGVGRGRMQDPSSALLLSAGEPSVSYQGSAAWYRQEGGPVCRWPRKPQPTESCTSSTVPWSWMLRPPETQPRPQAASVWPSEACAGCEHPVRSPALAHSQCHAFESRTHCTHAQGSTDLRPLGLSHTRALDDAPLQDGEALCGRPILA